MMINGPPIAQPDYADIDLLKVRGVRAVGGPRGIIRMSALRMLCRYRHSIRGADYYAAATREEDRC